MGVNPSQAKTLCRFYMEKISGVDKIPYLCK